jgi:hypothetical protein
MIKVLKKKYKKIKLWNQSFMLQHLLSNKSYIYICIYYLFNIVYIIKDLQKYNF